MKGITFAESKKWCGNHGIELNDTGRVEAPGDTANRVRIEVPTLTTRLVWFCRFLESALRPWDQCLLLVTAWGIWESSENWHLFYLIRHSYGESRLLDEAPGQLFLDFENNDLITCLEHILVSGWDARIVTSGGERWAFVSHDGWLELSVSETDELEEVRRQCTECGLALM